MASDATRQHHNAGMAIEREIKLPLPLAGVSSLPDKLIWLGFSLRAPRVHETNTIFDTAGRDLRGRGQLIRLRRVGERAILTYKGPGQSVRHKSREEIELDISDAGPMREILDRLGYRPVFFYEKFRTEYSRDQGILTIDETPIGNFLELEGVEEWIDLTAAELGYVESDYILLSYASLYLDYRQQHPEASSDMIFASGKRPLQ